MPAAIKVADVIRDCWETYNSAHRLPPYITRAIRHIIDCRTQALGGHIHQCDQCGSEVPMYNSCQDRHCPTCQTSAKEKWLGKRRRELLPVQYFHCVFTLPHSLNDLVSANRGILLGELFSTVNWVLQKFAQDPQWRLEGTLGVLEILHTWSQRLTGHFHIHCIVPGGVWRKETKEWIPCRGKWLFKKASLAAAFRNRYIKQLRSLRRRGKLAYRGKAAELADDAAWEALLKKLSETKWIVYPKAAPAGAEKSLEYLGRYTHKVAISNHRIKELKNGLVTYSWRDREDDNTEKEETIPTEEFTKRFCYHILPKGFKKIRFYGWLSAHNRKVCLPAIRKALNVPPPKSEPKLSLPEIILKRTGTDIALCPQCGKGHLRMTSRIIPKKRAPP